MPPEPEVSENTMIASMKVPPKRKGNEEEVTIEVSG